MITMQQVNNEDKYFGEHMFLSRWRRLIKKKRATKSISKWKRNFYLKQWNLLKNKWNQPRKRIFLRTDVIFTHELHRGRMSFEYFVKTVGPTLQIVFFFNFGFCVGASVSLLLFRTTNIVPTDNEKCNLVSNEKKRMP